MAKAYVLIGVSGSGKSTWAEDNKDYLEAEVLSSDDLRIEMYGFLDQNHNAEVFQELHRRARKLLSNGQNVIIDATNLSRKKRKHLTHNVLKGHEVFYEVFVLPIEDLLLRDVSRQYGKRVGTNVIMKQLKSFEFPFVNYEKEHEERFCDITIHRPYVNNDHYVKIVEIAEGFEQHSPWHTEDVMGHTFTSLGCFKYMHTNLTPIEYEQGIMALQYHDLGKPFTQEPHKNPKIEGHMTYHGHENVSTYIYLLFYTNFFITNLISAHIMINNVDSEKSQQKLIDRIGESCYNVLVELNKADKYRK